ncbi:HD domain-containing protein [Listeria innocua]|nr:HD domain-containing protein [Listeria innocua]EKJ8921736.1 HD domain-containing protein [Listeria innocua]EKJ8924612.1 HD domain-containing protein [Listeria innocua]EKJ8927457.1 HD domain-containing protein [Listeria innocua]EKJ8933234.1 HD domain-containing protein [Listeria innocua]
MGIHQYFQSLSDLENIYRCPGKFKYQEHSVAEHSYKVTSIAQFFGAVEEDAGNEVNWRALYEKALNHDYSELFIGDIKTPVKYATTELREMLSEVEESMTKNFISREIPATFQPVYRHLLKEGKDSTLEGKILAISDKVDLLYESFGEIQKGNPENFFVEIYSEALATIYEYREMASVKYFLKEILPDMLAEKGIEKTELPQLTTEITTKALREE